MWGNKPGESKGLFPTWMRSTIGPLFLIATTMPFAFLMVHTSDSAKLQGSLLALLEALVADPVGTIKGAWVAPTPQMYRVLGAFVLWELITMRLVPGKRHEGPTTASGHVPVYTANGMQCFLLTVAAFVGLSTDLGFGSSLPAELQFSATCLYDVYPAMISFLSVFALAFCAFLTVKGLYFPSGADSGSNGNLVVDYYWGTELYPRVLGWDIKMFTNCRFGMMLWALLPISFIAHQLAAHGAVGLPLAVNVAIQLIYVAKFFWWETGYLNSIDIMHDRAGYYICWGCLCWITSVYVSHSYFITRIADHRLAEALAAGGTAAIGKLTFTSLTDVSTWAWAPAPSEWHPLAYVAIFVAGVTSVWINYDADRQRAYVRANLDKPGAAVTIWGRPIEESRDIIRATYRTEKKGDDGADKGEEKTSILLVAGWWSVSRHFHYVPELAAAFLWSLPAGVTHFMPFFYFAFLTALLFDRAFRDDARCAKKYGRFYEEYRRRVPYKVIPGII